MQRLTIAAAAAAILFGGVMAGGPAKAEMHYGPMKNANQCYKASKSWGDMGFGAWGNCPGPASTAAPAIRRQAKKG